MNGLAWNYIEPTPIGSSGLVASNIQNAQAGMNNGLAGLKQLSDNVQLEQATRQDAERLSFLSNLPQGISDEVPDTGISVDTNNPASVITPNTYVIPTNMGGLANQTVSSTSPVPSGKGLARPPQAAEAYRGIVSQAAKTYGVPEDVILAVIQTESGFKPDAQSPTGVKGLMQVTQDTYKGLGFSGDRSDPTNSVNAGTKLLSQLYKQYGNWEDAFTVYNGGAHGVTGIRSGNWGTWSNNPSKQREISQYASRVNNYRTAWNK